MFESAALPAGERSPALHAGGLLVPHVQDRPRLNKPPAIYWAQSASAALLTGGDPRRDAIWMYRLPSLLAAIAAVLLTWRLGAALFTPAVGRLAATLLAVAPVIAWEAHQARADMLLLALTLATLYPLWLIAARDPSKPATPKQRWAIPAVFWLALALGVLAKGPITPMIAALTALTFALLTRRWRWLLDLRPVLGLLLSAALIAPWVYAVAQHVGFDRYLAIIHDEVLGRSLEPKEGHWGPPGYHLVALVPIFWPGVMLAGVAILAALREGLHAPDLAFDPAGSRARRLLSRLVYTRAVSPALAFVLAWLIPSWIVFELVSTKLPHYTMPLLPAVAILAARTVIRATAAPLAELRDRVTRLGLTLWAGVGLAFAVAIAVLAVNTGLAATTWSARLIAILAVLACASALGLTLTARRSLARAQVLRAQHAAVLAMLPLLMAACQLLLPGAMGLSARAAAHLTALDPAAARPLAMLGYHEDSMIFHTRGRITRLDAEHLPAWLAANPSGLLLARAGAPIDWSTLQVLAQSQGFNYSRGQHEDLVWAQPRPAQASP